MTDTPKPRAPKGKDTVPVDSFGRKTRVKKKDPPRQSEKDILFLNRELFENEKLRALHNELLAEEASERSKEK